MYKKESESEYKKRTAGQCIEEPMLQLKFLELIFPSEENQYRKMQSSKVYFVLTILFQIWYSGKSAGSFPTCDNFKCKSILNEINTVLL